MSTNPITVETGNSMMEATKLLKENDIRFLPVMEKGKLVGILTDGDLKRASASDATSLDVHELMYLLSELKIKDIMTKHPITVPSDYTLEETAEILSENKISGVPVVDNGGKVVGVITEIDLFRAMISLAGLKKRGIQFAFNLEDRSGSIKDIADIIRKYGGRMASILSSDEGTTNGYRKVYIRMYGIDRPQVPKLIEELKRRATLLYMVDLRENKREIFT
jgi:acetoin utilization protein AcuB